MIDIELLRKDADAVRANLARRHKPELLELLDSVIEMDEKWRKAQGELDALRAKRNELTEQIRKKKDAKLIAQARDASAHVKALEDEVAFLKPKLDFELSKIPVMLHKDVPDGKDANDNPVVRTWGKQTKPKFALASHGELIEALGIGDFDRASEIAGRGFNYIMGDLALLDRALQAYGIEFLIKNGFRFVEPPLMIRKRPMEGTTDFQAFIDVLYKIEGEDLYLIPSSENSLVPFYMDQVIDEDELPLKIVGVSPCFRKEIGSHSVDTKGLYRMHQFNKVEEVVICKPEDSWKWFEKLQAISEDILQSLKIPYRVVDICTGDIGSKQSRQYDIEAWFPRQGKYGEITSCSNCVDYQARGLNMKYGKRGGSRAFVHTLNNTCVATSRIMVAILENFQNEDGTVDVPKVLWPYMMGRKTIGKAK
ncbi:MAG: serine--tRNA ligase [Candidatus Aenigmatarchaeota archaeon]|nr:MAG: serine--tRNA ligase [Candidatus Aenigmarchaeota archaeon]